MLGCQVQFNNRFEKELIARETKAWRAYVVIKETVETRAVLDKQRYALFRATVEKSFFWCSGSWNLTKDNLQMVRKLHLRLLRRMFWIRRGEEESTEQYMERSTGLIYRRLRAVNGRKWDEEVHQACYNWGGHVARLQANRLSRTLLDYRNYDWLRALEKKNGGRQGHQRYLRVWRWEAQFTTSVGKDWRQQAANLQTWVGAAASFIQKRCKR